MLKNSFFFIAGLLAAQHAYSQTLQREWGDYDIKLGTTPSRSMAAGLVQPAASGSVHGGFDMTHQSGFYAGQWSPTMGLNALNSLEIDTYAGFKHPFDNRVGYEVGIIHYRFPDLDGSDSHEVYAGLKVLGSRFGAAFSRSDAQRDSTLFADLGGVPLLRLDMTMKVTNHQLTTPYALDDGSQVRGFSDWSVQLSRSLMGVDLALVYTDSSLASNNCAAYSGQNSQCDGVFTVKAQRSFF
jgi:uncharacterized protein (TIGR02001 family)